VLERRTKVVQLTHSGLTDDEIAAELGYANRSGVWKARQRALTRSWPKPLKSTERSRR
jgi:orotate phosphoribosyltransferase-like protein